MKKITALFFSVLMIFALTSCEKMDPDYGASDLASTPEVVEEEKKYEDVEIPSIKSDDEVMPKYFDISLYDEENYSDIYLGKKFEFKINYSGSEMEVPSSYKKMLKNGWSVVAEEGYDKDSQLMAGKSLKVNFINQYKKQIVAVFYNATDSSVSLKNCPIVKFIVPENIMDNTESVYGQFFVNGISNESAITDIIEYLGAPSHFYNEGEGKYYLDYFVTEKDKRSGITVYIDVNDDTVDAIEFSMY